MAALRSTFALPLVSAPHRALPIATCCVVIRSLNSSWLYIAVTGQHFALRDHADTVLCLTLPCWLLSMTLHRLGLATLIGTMPKHLLASHHRHRSGHGLTPPQQDRTTLYRCYVLLHRNLLHRSLAIHYVLDYSFTDLCWRSYAHLLPHENFCIQNKRCQ